MSRRTRRPSQLRPSGWGWRLCARLGPNATRVRRTRDGAQADLFARLVSAPSCGGDV
jgi:hypothetical protein